MQPGTELAEVFDRRPRLLQRLGDERVPALQCQLERDHDVDQPLLRPVVEVSAEPPALRVRGFDDPPA